MLNFNKFNIDLNKPIPKLEMTLYKNRTTAIGKIIHYHNLNNTITMGEIDSITFDIPYYISKNGKKQQNRMFDKIKYRYFVKVKYNNIENLYVVQDSTLSSDKLEKNIKLEITPFMLKETSLYDYNVVSATIKDICNGNALEDINGILKDTIWTLGHIDDSLLEKRRGIELSGKSNVLDALYQIAKRFGAIIKWDTINNVVNFYDENDFGEDRGLVFQYNKYLESLKLEEKTDNVVTILKVSGKNGVSINSFNPTGQSYLTDYSYFLYPYQEDKEGNVIKHSDYMSDELCHALINFTEIVNKNKGKLKELIKKKSLYDYALSQKDTQLKDLYGQLEAIEDKLSVAQSTNTSQKFILDEKNKKVRQINEKKEEIESLKKDKESVDIQINSVKYILSEEHNFSNSLLEELKDYKISRDYINNDIEDEKELLLAAQEEFEKYKQPKRIISIEIVDFLKLVEARKDWDNLNIGDIVTINYHKFNIDKVKARITKIEFDHENNNIRLTISTIDELNPAEQFAKMLYNSNSTSAIVSETRHQVTKIKDVINNLQETIYNAWKAGQRQIIAGAGEKTIINHLGFTTFDKDNPNMGIRLNNGVIMVTNEGESHFRQFIDGNGNINAECIKGKLDTKKVDIQVSPNNVIDSSGRKITDVIEDQLSELEDDIEKELWEQAQQQFDRTDEICNWIDSLNDDYGVFKVETNDTLASKVSNEHFKTYVIQTADIISSKADNGDFQSYRTQTARTLANMVRDVNGNSSKIAMNEQIIATKVGNKEFTSEISQLANKIESKVGSSEVHSIVRQSATDVQYAFNNISPSVTMHYGGIKLGKGCSVDCDSINSTDSGNPIVRLFGNCAVDATANNEKGRGSSVRLKWSNRDYIRVQDGGCQIYGNGSELFYIFADGRRGGRCRVGFTFENDLVVGRSLSVKGDKNCIQSTRHYGDRLFYSIEDAESYLTRQSTHKYIAKNKREDGFYEVTIPIDKIYSECVNLDLNYKVHIDKYGKGDIWVENLTKDSFTVVSENQIYFDWTICAKRSGFENRNLNQFLG